MTAPQHRRPLPAVVFIGALTILTAIVWVRVLDRGTASGDSGDVRLHDPEADGCRTYCPTTTTSRSSS